jgi:hypothetical protein
LYLDEDGDRLIVWKLQGEDEDGNDRGRNFFSKSLVTSFSELEGFAHLGW